MIPSLDSSKYKIDAQNLGAEEVQNTQKLKFLSKNIDRLMNFSNV